jgi:hypothetical protein
LQRNQRQQRKRRRLCIAIPLAVAVVQIDPYKRIGPEAPPSIIVVPPDASRGIDSPPAPTPVATPVAQTSGEG